MSTQTRIGAHGGSLSTPRRRTRIFSAIVRQWTRFIGLTQSARAQVRVHALHTLTRRQITHFLRVYNYAPRSHGIPELTQNAPPNCYRDVLIYIIHALLDYNQAYLCIHI